VKKILQKIDKWFELNLGFIFVNPNKADQWNEYIRKKYNIKQNNKKS
jgi:1-acyl-sn-glycerol-3-phosphate acyltransferase